MINATRTGCDFGVLDSSSASFSFSVLNIAGTETKWSSYTELQLEELQEWSCSPPAPQADGEISHRALLLSGKLPGSHAAWNQIAIAIISE